MSAMLFQSQPYFWVGYVRIAGSYYISSIADRSLQPHRGFILSDRSTLPAPAVCVGGVCAGNLRVYRKTVRALLCVPYVLCVGSLSVRGRHLIPQGVYQVRYTQSET